MRYTNGLLPYSRVCVDLDNFTGYWKSIEPDNPLREFAEKVLSIAHMLPNARAYSP